MDRKAPDCFAEELKWHYDRQLEMFAQHGLGAKNCDEQPIPRPQRFVYEKLLTDFALTSRGFRTPLPAFVEGCQVLLVGCGTGADAMVLARLVGEEGRVLAIDADESAIEIARSALEPQCRAFGCSALNVDFEVGYPERLDLVGVDDESFDCVVFNLTLGFALDMAAALDEFQRGLKPGGELYGSLLTSDRRFLQPLLDRNEFVHPVLRAATYLSDFRRWLAAAGFPHFRYMQKRRAYVIDEAERKLLEQADLVVRFIRTFKIADMEERCENYGNTIEYLGEAPGCPQFFELDDYHRFFVDVPLRVCGNTYALATQSRFARWFRAQAPSEPQHFGMYTYCSYNKRTQDDAAIIDYLEDGLESCVNCSYHEHCIVDGHCQHVYPDGSKYLDWHERSE